MAQSQITVIQQLIHIVEVRLQHLQHLNLQQLQEHLHLSGTVEQLN